MKIAIGSDHAGFTYKERIKTLLASLGHEVHDFGTDSAEPVDYPARIRSRNLLLDAYNLVTASRQFSWSRAAAGLRDAADFLAQPFRWVTGAERSDTFVKDDIRPGLAELAGIAGLVLGRSAERREPFPERPLPKLLEPDLSIPRMSLHSPSWRRCWRAFAGTF